MVTVIYGADSEQADLKDRSVAEVRALYANVFNLAPEAIAKVNGKQVSEDYKLQDGDKLEFQKAANKFAA
jgi:sulfur carrier protein ThiS